VQALSDTADLLPLPRRLAGISQCKHQSPSARRI